MHAQISFVGMESDNNHIVDLWKNLPDIINLWEQENQRKTAKDRRDANLFQPFDKTTNHRSRRNIAERKTTATKERNDEVYAALDLLQIGQLTESERHHLCHGMRRRKLHTVPAVADVAEIYNPREQFGAMLASLPAPQHVQP